MQLNNFCTGAATVVDMVYDCLEKISVHLTRESRREFMVPKVRLCVKDFGKQGDTTVRKRAVYNWSIGEAPGSVISDLCVKCFSMSYDISHNLVEAICKQLRPGFIQHSSDRILGDRTAVKDDKWLFKELERLAERKNFQLTADDRALMLVPKTEEAIDCFTWMHEYFTDFGEKVPNGDKIHLEHVPIKSIWEEYVEANKDKIVPLSYKSFVRLWHTCFPHVRIREYKQCCGKCNVCFKLSEARRSTKDPAAKEYFTYMHRLHRTMYMGERKTYAERRKMARDVPSKYVSTISDGMAQLHCLLPYFANKYTVSMLYVLSHY